MGYKLNKEELIGICKHFDIECCKEETVPELVKKLNNYHGKAYYKNGNNGITWISSKNRSILDKTAMASKNQKPTGDMECPTCKRLLPIKKFLNLSNYRMKHCNECRQKMGVK